MTEHAQHMLLQADHVLFAHKACHVFALVLKNAFGYPLLLISSEPGRSDRHFHIACAPEPNVLLDVFGWFTFQQHLQEEAVTEEVRFRPVEEDQLKTHFAESAGPGLYSPPIFIQLCEERARKWITRHIEYYNGKRKEPIPGLTRVGTTSPGIVIRH